LKLRLDQLLVTAPRPSREKRRRYHQRLRPGHEQKSDKPASLSPKTLLSESSRPCPTRAVADSSAAALDAFHIDLTGRVSWTLARPLAIHRLHVARGAMRVMP